MKLHGLLVLAAGLLAAADVPKGGAGKDDLKRLQGTWSTVSVERGGVAAPEEEARKIKLTVRGNQYTLTGEEEPIEGTLELNPARRPKELDAVRNKGPDAGKTIKGIYELKGDTLRVCLGAPGKSRPTGFDTGRGGGEMLYVHKRAKR